MVSSAVALRLRPAALMVLPAISSSPPLMSPILRIERDQEAATNQHALHSTFLAAG